MNTSNWKKTKKEIIKNFKFTNFKKAIDFVNKVGEIAEKLNHHPDIKIYNYNQVELKLSTHDTKSVTEQDYKLANEIDKI
ncbi:MAG: hypothetical protein A2725_02585 [Candidatus Magasanikbacteria bacterium RIFCSPHIGHO2_01_FULL_33_34]|uniref:4a-hydroxytetrahydrobiopterin dehydratase n=1 Tax=Candidatus Magasanikbacteria bacterium RIFCSPHIGHO2_01_FULL_33_34 TaxID=1798671 RepID=A0A1F6LKI4_9BACT|nr:MAG: hypothetical protein A2725_02585 [Candidatus Magasanikbacteria bacterium RIFCSPHIGHO2_01_FULL_33_34]OGH65594.1 MAG: hypothetical protein A3B83_01815 [Candidatus Magasanikbacteria bacterium RIFCSPHIGHO2_02_FULL_33_17]OGH75803.1 MAG: hypothetical protein A3A89_02710 [Candidatus Magasanikbacteria bacterium RIFCSPLOWO2_01_FULL_33_34]OGH81341.1 MAG: hypothetical protein A3F93_02140 [Candidatus Magasanikbacteria bacterium RIFCSPLOWO2_12_FULL_34_7]